MSLALLITEHRSNRLDGLRNILATTVFPVQYIADLPHHLTIDSIDNVRSLFSIKEENERLRKEQLIYKTQLLKYEALEQENIRLRALLEKSFQLGETVLVAELLSVNLAPYEHIVVVNKGSRFGVFPKQPVMDTHGVFGQVFRSLPFSSEIMLITDPSHAIPVQINRNGLRTIAVGGGQINRLNVPYLPNNADVKVGDLLITSGLGGTFPQGYPVAVIDEIIPQPNKPFAQIHATPKAQLNRSRELLIVFSSSSPVPLTTPKTKNESTTEQNHVSK